MGMPHSWENMIFANPMAITHNCFPKTLLLEWIYFEI